MHIVQKNLSGILVVMVLYKVKLEDSMSFITLSESMNDMSTPLDILVYDNSSEIQSISDINFHKWNIHYIHDPSNSGVSKAYNKGAELSEKMNKKWILLLDQDTTFPVQAIKEYLFAINKYPDAKLFVPIMLVNQQTIISPCYFKFMRGFSANHVDIGENSLNKFSVINCGICVDANAFKKNDGYNELIKLDFSDHDFIRRFRKSIGENFIVIDLKVCHELSGATKNNVNTDLVRFDYYLAGAKYMTSSLIESLFLKLNAALRSVKLSLIHRNIGFLIKLFKWI